MGLTARESQLKREAYESGRSNDLSGLPEPTVERLKAERARREELRQEFDARQAEAAKQREDLLRAEYLAAGNTQSDWLRDREHLLRDAALQRAKRHSSSLISPAEFLA